MKDSAGRKSNQELPGEKELREILDKEAARKTCETKAERHYAEFDVVSQLSKSLGLSDRWLESPEDEDMVARAAKILNAGDKWAESAAAVILEASTAALDAVYDYLAEQDEPKEADYLIVMGGRRLNRPKKASEIYEDGLVKKLVVTGSNPNYAAESEQPPEWQVYKDELINLGVDENDILLEKQGITVPDCVFRTLNLLDGEGGYQSLGVVTSDWNLRRAWAHLMKMSPEDTEVLRFGAGTLPQSSREEWFKTEGQARIVLNEFVKMRVAQETNTI